MICLTSWSAMLGGGYSSGDRIVFACNTVYSCHNEGVVSRIVPEARSDVEVEVSATDRLE